MVKDMLKTAKVELENKCQNQVETPGKFGYSVNMVTMSQIEDLGRRIGHEFHTDRVVLFGSHAQGSATADSDVDLLVILPFEGKSVNQSVQMRMKLRPVFPVDLLVRTPENVQHRLEMGDSFMREILKQGKVLYEADNS